MTCGGSCGGSSGRRGRRQVIRYDNRKPINYIPMGPTTSNHVLDVVYQAPKSSSKYPYNNKQYGNYIYGRGNMSAGMPYRNMEVAFDTYDYPDGYFCNGYRDCPPITRPVRVTNETPRMQTDVVNSERSNEFNSKYMSYMDAVQYYTREQPQIDAENMDRWKNMMKKETPKLYFRPSQKQVSSHFIPIRQLY